MTAIGKTISICLFQCLKMNQCKHLFSFKLVWGTVGYQKTQNFMLILNSLKRAQKMFREKVIGKKRSKFF
jgi:hypothetical protein